MESKDQEVPAWAVALWRAQKQRVEQAKNAVIEMERKVAQIQREEEEAQARYEAALLEEKMKNASDE